MKISIVMPVARIDNFFLLTLENINQQTYRNFELIIVCSVDIYEDILKILKGLSFSFSTRIIQAKLRGVAFAANLGIDHSLGEFIARWDSDDLCDSNRFERQLEEFNKDPSLGVIGTRVALVDENGDFVKFQNFKYYQYNNQIRRALKYRQPLLHSSLMFRSEILFENRGYLYGHTSEDHEMFIRIARNKKIRFMNLPHVMTYYRRHSSQLSDISHQHSQFYEIAGFMFSEFLRTWNPLYIVGILVNIPILRRMRHKYRAFKRFLAR